MGGKWSRCEECGSSKSSPVLNYWIIINGLGDMRISKHIEDGDLYKFYSIDCYVRFINKLKTEYTEQERKSKMELFMNGGMVTKRNTFAFSRLDAGEIELPSHKGDASSENLEK